MVVFPVWPGKFSWENHSKRPHAEHLGDSGPVSDIRKWSVHWEPLGNIPGEEREEEEIVSFVTSHCNGSWRGQ